eukprot:1630923-Prymnesium_polylepis.1
MRPLLCEDDCGGAASVGSRFSRFSTVSRLSRAVSRCLALSHMSRAPVLRWVSRLSRGCLARLVSPVSQVAHRVIRMSRAVSRLFHGSIAL